MGIAIFRLLARNRRFHAFGAAEGEGFLGAEGDEVALDFGDQAECEAEDLAVDGVVEAVTFLGGVDVDAFFEACAHYGHDVSEVPAQARDFGDDEGVATFHPSDGPSEFPASDFRLSADDFHDPAVHHHVVLSGVSVDFILLVFEVLLSGADS